MFVAVELVADAAESLLHFRARIGKSGAGVRLRNNRVFVGFRPKTGQLHGRLAAVGPGEFAAALFVDRLLDREVAVDRKGPVEAAVAAGPVHDEDALVEVAADVVESRHVSVSSKTIVPEVISSASAAMPAIRWRARERKSGSAC